MNFNLSKQELKDFKSNKYEYFDWYDYDKVEKLNQSRSKQWLKIYKKIMDAREKDDKSALTKAYEELSKHEKQDSILKKKAEDAGFYWC